MSADRIIGAPASQAELAGLHAHDHPCVIYETPEELAAVFVPYFQAGLVLGERCIYVVDENSAEFVLTALQQGGFNLQPYVDSRALLIVHSSEAHLRGGSFNEQKMTDFLAQVLSDARSAGFRALRVAGEMTWALSGAPGCEGLAGYEARLNNFTSVNQVSLMCQYRRSRFDAAKLKGIIHAHPQVVVNKELLENPTFIRPSKFVEADAELELQVALDNLTLIKRLQNTSLDLERAYEELQHLAYVISHELQEPLSVIRSYQNLLAVRYQDRLGTDADEFISECTRASNTVARMIDDLWTYARISKGNDSFAEFEAQHALNSALDNLEQKIAEKRAFISVDRLPRVYGVQAQVADVFRRLIDNAISYSAVTQPKIHISVQRNGLYWEFAVHDNGKGMDPIDARDAFKLFYRFNQRPGSEGTGMGLPICKKVMEQHGGRMWIDTRTNGTKVCFCVPASRAFKLPQFDDCRNRSAS